MTERTQSCQYVAVHVHDWSTLVGMHCVYVYECIIVLYDCNKRLYVAQFHVVYTVA
jgi:hypothetical protein